MKINKHGGLSAVILSAGFSSRMKDFKPLLFCGKKMMIETVVDLFRSNGIEDIIVVTGHNRQRLEAVVEHNGAVPVFNPDFEKGMLSSIQKGVKTIRGDSKGFFLLPVDIPAIRQKTIERLINMFNSHPDSIIMPCFDGQTGHPPIIPNALKDQIQHLGSKSSLRDLLALKRDKTRMVAVHDRGILMDADDPKDYRLICRRMESIDIPDKEECLSIVNEVLCRDDQIRRHLADVSMTSLKLAHAVQENINTNLVIAAGLLHDIKRKEKHHAQKGASFIRGIGFDRVARIIDQHMDITIDSSTTINEKEIVYFADKICNGKGLDLNYHKRFALRMKQSPWAAGSIAKRYENTQLIQARIEASAGKPVEKIFFA